LELDKQQQKCSSGFSFSDHNSPNQSFSSTLNGANSNGSLLNSQNSILNSNVNNSNNLNNHQQTASNFPNRTRIRTSFDPEHELPKLHRWFAENQHPTRQQIQEYVRILNNLESRRGRKPLDINNVVYWFKNARAAAKRSSGARLLSGSSPQMNGNSNQNNNDQLNANELMMAQFSQHQQRQLINQLQLLNQHQNVNIADFLSNGANKNMLKSLMLKNAGLMNEDELLNETNDEEDEQNIFQNLLNNHQRNKQRNDEFQSKNSEDEDEQNEDTDQAISNFAQTLDLSVNKQSSGNSMSNLKRRKIDTASFDDCDEIDEKDDSIGSASPINQLNKRNDFNRSNLNNSNKQRFSLNKQLNTLKSISQVNQDNFIKQEMKDDNQQLVNSDGELDDENQESENELDEKDYYASILNATMQNARSGNSIGQLAQNIVGNNLAAANFLNTNYLQQTMNDLFVNRLIASQGGNAAVSAAVAANNNLLNSAAGLIAASSAGSLNTANSHPLSALTSPSSVAFGNNQNLLLNNPNSPDDGIRRIRRSRTFIDPITEVPRLEQWFKLNTHPTHTQIIGYTDELNKLPYRQKFPKLEPKNVQFWFKNFRAKSKRLSVPGLNGNTLSTNQNSSTTASITSQSNSQSDSPTPPANDLLCMNGQSNRALISNF